MDNTTNLSEGQDGLEGPEVPEVGTKVYISCFLIIILRFSNTSPPTDAKEEQKEEEMGLFHLRA